MGRTKWPVSRDSGFAKRRGTPAKPALSRRYKHRRPLPNKHYATLPEEPEVEEMIPTVKPRSPVRTSTKPECKSVLHLTSPAYTENPRHIAISAATPADKKSGYQVSPAWHQTVQMTPDPKAFKGCEMPVEYEEQNLAVTPKSITSSSMETDTTFNFDDDEEDCYSSASSSSSSLPSPEIFRKENYVQTLAFSMKEELLGLHLNIKNSTLLDVSHAETIHMHHPPDLSTIIGASTTLAEKNCNISKHRGPEAETSVQTDSFQPDNQAQAFNCKTTAKSGKPPSCLLQITSKRPILCKKKVSFKTPIIAETFEVKHSRETKLTAHNASESVGTSTLAEQMKPDAETSRAGEIHFKDVTQHLMVTLKSPVKSSPENAKFFDFVSESDREMFFQRMRERCVKLRSTPLFPLSC
ncbi:uncharacterized protein LOC130182614 isoform X1 [Seriola aureovittata]|uniref:uncharacterized protein LOC130182614 isoform X1 n=1 Tax=Seriola aureovittata TaxID=2871759 RepID=UPI0024BD7DCB|nr:uncharacterized protein LOC130182614 isoform X1 [Seriola aureovittata]